MWDACEPPLIPPIPSESLDLSTVTWRRLLLENNHLAFRGVWLEGAPLVEAIANVRGQASCLEDSFFEHELAFMSP